MRDSEPCSIDSLTVLDTIRLLVACPHCATPIEAVTTERHHAYLQVTMRGKHTCPGVDGTGPWQ
jgi:hypothetical protein